MAKVKWLQEHPDRWKFGEPVEIWYNDCFQPIGPSPDRKLERRTSHSKAICLPVEIGMPSKKKSHVMFQSGYVISLLDCIFGNMCKWTQLLYKII